MKVELPNQETTVKFKIKGFESSTMFKKEESIKISYQQVAMKKEMKLTVLGLENKFESLHGKVNEMLVKKAEHMNERISSFFSKEGQTKPLNESLAFALRADRVLILEQAEQGVCQES